MRYLWPSLWQKRGSRSQKHTIMFGLCATVYDEKSYIVASKESLVGPRNKDIKADLTFSPIFFYDY